MSTIITFDPDEIQRMRQKSVGVWQEQIPEDTPEGWSQSPVDFTPLLAVFPSIDLKSNFVLRAYQFRERNDGNGKVWAIPKTSNFPDIDEYLDDDLIDDPPHPEQALDDIMEAITGDGTPFSYLCASLFAREIGEFGTFGHGIDWGEYQIIGHNPLTTNVSEDWQWLEPEPIFWSPLVQMDKNAVTVKFFSLTSLGYPKISLHIDTYIFGNYQFMTQNKLIAKGKNGYVY